MEKIIHVLINNWVKGSDIYTHHGSTWLIITNNKEWIIELSESGVLWYNFQFFRQIFEFMSLDAFENQHHITKWVEENVIDGIKEVKEVMSDDFNVSQFLCEEAIKKGVIRTTWGQMNDRFVGDVVKYGEKINGTFVGGPIQHEQCESVVRYGIKNPTY